MASYLPGCSATSLRSSSSTAPAARRFSNCGGKHSHGEPERVARLEDTLALARAERAIGQWYLQTVELQEKTVELQERLDMQTAMQTATLGIANLANSDSEVNTRNPKRFKAEKN